MKLRSTLLLTSLLSSAAFAQYAGVLPVPGDLRSGFDAIKQSDAREWLGYLAGPECKGRGSGQPGYLKAAEYMAQKFKEFGVKPGANGSYFQNVPMVSGKILDGSSLKIGSFEVQVGPNLAIRGATGEATKTGDAVLLEANGIVKVPEEVAGKVVVAFLSAVPRDFRRALTEKAALVIEVADVVTDRREFSSFGTRAQPSARLLAASGHDLMTSKGLTRTITDDTIKISPLGEATLTIKAEATTNPVPNVVGIIEGSDPTLKGEYVGIGGHLDHLGERTSADGVTTTYWGADDDGSGCTALLNVAKAFKESKVKPKRSILFMAFCGEELGLVGSRWLADNPMFPIDKMTCELQMDMVGRNSEGAQNGNRNRMDVFAENVDTMRLVGSQRISTELHKLVLDMNQHVGFKFKYDSEDVYTRSDHYSFAAKGIPVAFLFSGFHPDYHKPTDTIDKINFDKLTNAARLFYLVAMQAANKPAMLARDVPQGGG